MRGKGLRSRVGEVGVVAGFRVSGLGLPAWTTSLQGLQGLTLRLVL